MRIIHHPTIPSSHHPTLQEHHDKKNVDGVFATSISVMEDAADALQAGLYFTHADGSRVFTGEGAVEADFTLHAHGVTSGCSSKRYSLTIYKEQHLHGHVGEVGVSGCYDVQQTMTLRSAEWMLCSSASAMRRASV